MSFTLGQSIVMIPLSRLNPIAHGVRRTNGIAIDNLAASIYAEGLIQNLTVVPDPDSPLAGAPELQNYQVIAGSRRLRAMRKLVADKKWHEDTDIPCRIVHESEALSASLAENMIREQMHPADEFVAFRDMIDAGKTVEEVAQRFGVTPIAVQRRLKLANVSPRLFELYREGDMALDQITALAIVDDHKAQENAWFKAEGTWGQKPERLREVLTKKEVSFREDPLARFVGRQEYETAGGKTHVDLFSDAGDGYATDVKLLQKIAAQKLNAIAESVRHEGWSWVEIEPESSMSDILYSNRFDRAQHVGFRKPDDTQKKRLQELESVRKECGEKLHKIEEAAGEVEIEDNAEADALQDRIDAVQGELREIKEALKKWDPKVLAKCGAVVALEYGHARVYRGLYKGKLRAESAKKKGADAGSGELAEEKATHSQALTRDLTIAVTHALQVEFIANPGVAIIELTHSLLVQAFRYEDSETDDCEDEEDALFDFSADSIRIGRSDQFPHSVDDRETHSSADTHRFLNERDAIRAMLPKRVSDWRAWLHADCKCIPRLLAFCVARGVDGTSGYNGELRAQALMRAVKLNMATRWTPTREKYLSRVSIETIRAALDECGITHDKYPPGALKKAELIEYAEPLLAAANWLPRELRTT